MSTDVCMNITFIISEFSINILEARNAIKTFQSDIALKFNSKH